MSAISDVLDRFKILRRGDLNQNQYQILISVAELLEQVLRGIPATDSIRGFAADVTLTSNDSVVFMDATAAARTVTLPAASSMIDVDLGTVKILYIKKSDISTNNVTLVPVGTDTIEGLSSYILSDAFGWVILISDGTDWFRAAANESRVVLKRLASGDTVPFATIASALAAAATGSSADAVIVGPGDYDESVTVPAGVQLVCPYPGRAHINGAGGFGSAGTRVTLGANSSIDGFETNCPSDAVPAISQASAGSVSFVRNCRFEGSGGALGIGVQNSGTGVLAVENCQYAGGSADTWLDLSGTGNLIVRNCVVTFGTLASALRLGGGGTADVNSFLVLSASTVTDGVEHGNAFLRAIDLTIAAANNIHVVHASASAHIFSSILDEAGSWDFLVDPALANNGHYGMTGVVMRQTNMSYPAAWRVSDNFIFLLHDDTASDVSIRCAQELHVGSFGKPHEFAAGGGDSTTEGMHVITTDNTAAPGADGGTLTDVSAAAASATGSTVTIQGLDAGNSICFGSDLADLIGTLPHCGLKVSQTVQGVDGSWIWEYSTAAGWSPLNVMAADADTPYAAYGSRVFERGIPSSEQIRYGPTIVGTPWARRTLLGDNLFWVRARVASLLTTAPVWEQFKLHSDRLEVNGDGFIEVFGNGRKRKAIAGVQTAPLVGPGAPGNNTVLFSTNITLALTLNQLADNQAEGLGGTFIVPEGLDTSFPVRLLLTWKPSTANTGNAEFSVDYVILPPAALVDGSVADTNVTVLHTVGVASLDVEQRTIIELPISTAVPGDLIVFRVLRDASAGNLNDTLAAAVELVRALPDFDGVFWQ